MPLTCLVAFAFTDAEKAVLEGTIESLSKAASAAVEPATRLVDGAKAIGIGGLSGIAADLQGAVSTLQGAITNVKISS